MTGAAATRKNSKKKKDKEQQYKDARPIKITFPELALMEAVEACEILDHMIETSLKSIDKKKWSAGEQEVFYSGVLGIGKMIKAGCEALDEAMFAEHQRKVLASNNRTFYIN